MSPLPTSSVGALRGGLLPLDGRSTEDCTEAGDRKAPCGVRMAPQAASEVRLGSLGACGGCARRHTTHDEESALMSAKEREEPTHRASGRAVAGAVAALLVPRCCSRCCGFARRSMHGLDARWEQHPAHFWLVLAVAALATMLAYVAARGRRHARLLSSRSASSRGRASRRARARHAGRHNASERAV